MAETQPILVDRYPSWTSIISRMQISVVRICQQRAKWID